MLNGLRKVLILFRDVRIGKWSVRILILFLLAFMIYHTVRFSRNLGLQKGYAPAQPVAFSHKTHAGEYRISCQYCHTGADKSKHALIPSVSTCMNCHKGIKRGTLTGEGEIKKIENAYRKKKPLTWIRVHNLPDHVYFSHAQHVKAGGLDCKSCHGNVEEMDIVEQVNTLSMGWCLDCHRNYAVKFEGNKYYARYEKLHDEIKSGKRNRITVAELGGLDCVKCHY